MKYLIAILLSVSALADVVGVHVASWHSKPGYDNSNPGLYYRRDSLQAGIYQNSYGNTAIYAGKTYETDVYHGVKAGVLVGVVHGYRWAIAPMAVATVSYGNVRIGYTPKIGSKIAESAMVHLMFEAEY